MMIQKALEEKYILKFSKEESFQNQLIIDVAKCYVDELNEELKKYSEKLAMRKQIIVATKIDVKNEECYQELKDLAEKENLEFYQISSATGDGVQELIDHVANVLKTLPKEELVQVEEKMVYTLPDKEQQWEARREGNVFYVTGRAVDRLMNKY